jgi:hypothetical protein
MDGYPWPAPGRIETLSTFNLPDDPGLSALHPQLGRFAGGWVIAASGIEPKSAGLVVVRDGAGHRIARAGAPGRVATVLTMVKTP